MLSRTVFLRVLIVVVTIACVTPSRASTSDFDCLSETIYRESRGEPEKGQIAVAWVVLNRIRSSLFPDTVCDVVKQRGQFPWAAKRLKLTYDDRSASIALGVLDGTHPDPTNGSLYFQSVRYFDNKKMNVKIGNHYFFGHKNNND